MSITRQVFVENSSKIRNKTGETEETWKTGQTRKTSEAGQTEETRETPQSGPWFEINNVA